MALRLDVRPAEPLRARVAVEVTPDATPEPTGRRDVYWPERRTVTADAGLYRWGRPARHDGSTGPALVDYPDTTVVLRPDLRMVVEPGGNLTIELED